MNTVRDTAVNLTLPVCKGFPRKVLGSLERAPLKGDMKPHGRARTITSCFLGSISNCYPVGP